MCSLIDMLEWKKKQKDSDDFWHRKLTLNVKFWYFLTAPHYSNFQNLGISFEYSWFSANLSNFVSLPWTLHNRECHSMHSKEDVFFSLQLLEFCSDLGPCNGIHIWMLPPGSKKVVKIWSSHFKWFQKGCHSHVKAKVRGLFCCRAKPRPQNKAILACKSQLCAW